MTTDRAYLFTDGRYFLQAEKQLDKSVQIVLRSAGLLGLSRVQKLDFDEAGPTRRVP